MVLASLFCVSLLNLDPSVSFALERGKEVVFLDAVKPPPVATGSACRLNRLFLCFGKGDGICDTSILETMLSSGMLNVNLCRACAEELLEVSDVDLVWVLLFLEDDVPGEDFPKKS